MISKEWKDENTLQRKLFLMQKRKIYEIGFLKHDASLYIKNGRKYIIALWQKLFSVLLIKHDSVFMLKEKIVLKYDISTFATLFLPWYINFSFHFQEF